MNSWFKPFTKVVAEQKSPLNRLVPVEKSTNLREVDALDVEFSKWLPLAELFRTKYREDITNLGRFLQCHKGLKESLQRQYTGVS